MIRIDQVKLPIKEYDGERSESDQVREKLSKLLNISANEISDLEILRRAIDARDKKNILYVYNISFSYRGDELSFIKKHKKNISLYEPKKYKIYKSKNTDIRPVIAGAGPAGLFAAYALCLSGVKPILIERGRPVEMRRVDVDRFWESGVLMPESNVQFGEGGAGAFSDGKLNTLIKDRDGSMRFVLEAFVKFGAPSEILYDYKPHIGTDVLVDVIKNMRLELLRLGCDIRFETKLTDIELFGDRLTGIILNDSEHIPCDFLILSIGHSARDTFYMLHEHSVPMQAKEFAVGLRIEHPREFIDRHQFGADGLKYLKAAPYKLATKLSSGRGVYSFCMCPGGYVVNSSSEAGHLVVNGMSYSARDGKNSNSAIVVSVGKNEFDLSDPLSGIEYQRKLEKKAYELGGGKIPQQLYGDFRNKVLSGMSALDQKQLMTENTPESIGDFFSQNKGGSVMADLSNLFSHEINNAFIDGMTEFDKKMRGFSCDCAILSGVESRTSSPVRIPRDETFQSKIRGLYPCGEGAGYAGGITSAAMDGLRVANSVVSELKQKGK